MNGIRVASGRRSSWRSPAKASSGATIRRALPMC